MDEKQRLNEERLRKFREMGLPEPMAIIDPGTMSPANASPEKLSKLEAIKNGALKNQLKPFIEKSSPTGKFQPLEVPKPKNQRNNNQSKNTAPALSEIKAPSINPEAAAIEQMLFGDNRPSPALSRHDLVKDNYDPNQDKGKNFVDNFRVKLNQTLAQKQALQGTNSNSNSNETVGLPAGSIIINEEELERKIIDISSQISKKISAEMIKKVLNEYVATAGDNLITESKNVKKAKFLKENIVEIEGKYYKLTPVTIKKPA